MSKFSNHRLFKALIVLGLLLAGCQDARVAFPQAETTPVVRATTILEPTPVDLEIERQATQPWRIALVVKDEDLSSMENISDYWLSAWRGAEQAGRDFGVEVELLMLPEPCAPQPDCVEPQIRLIAGLIERGETDGLVIAPFDSNRLVPVVEKAIDAGIPTVAMDNAVNSDKLLTFVMFDNFAAGRVIGEWVVEQLGGTGTALVLEGPPDQQNALDRRDGFLAGLRSGDIDVLDTQRSDWSVELAGEAARAWLDEFSDIDVILAPSDREAIAVAEAVAEANRQGILITGFNATDVGLKAIADGQIAATVDQSPDQQARLAIQLLIRHLETGETFPSIIFMPDVPLVTRENVENYVSEQ